MARNPAERLIKKDNPHYNVIGDYISSKESVVGIDARHTHIIIIKKLIQLEEKLRKINKRLKTIEAIDKKKKKG
jgi:hypothetical protein